ncbi:aminotransferase class IV [Xanthomonas sp. MUS 060]|uniref:aminotransferase class IV n=1 Tax=Xanthomonas sp. MUS 060 TaxID=1588031 RepID=UPI000697C032|nr:aminotransferase class IV [Xanthomonas sp. MUS 060]
MAKLIVTRGSTERGYRCALAVAPNWVLSLNEALTLTRAQCETGFAVKMCQTRLSQDPQLAGIKHLNRLPQVLARREWELEYQDGLLMDTAGRLVEGCTSNLFLV